MSHTSRKLRRRKHYSNLKGPAMNLKSLALAMGVAYCLPASIDAACCYFSAKNADILQPAQKVFITWDPQAQTETFTVQPKFEGNALDFGMVIPTPSQPKLHEMPRDFFKHLAYYTIMKKREFAVSNLLPTLYGRSGQGRAMNALAQLSAKADRDGAEPGKKPTVIVLETGVVGSLDYKIIEATR